MTGFKQDPLRQSADEVRFDQAEQERLDMHEEYLRRVNASARSTPVTIFQGRPADFDPSLGQFSKHWTSDIRVAQNFGQNVYATQIRQEVWDASQEATLQANPNISPRNVAMGLERHLPLSYAEGAFPVSVAKGVPAPALIPPQTMPRVEPPARIGNPWGPPVPQQGMLAQRLGGLRPAEAGPGAVETLAETTQRVGTGITRALGLPASSASLGELQFRQGQRGPMPSQYVDPATGEITVSGRHIQGAQRALAGAYSGVMERGRGMDPKMLSANLTRALGEAGQKYIKEVQQEGTRAAGKDPGSEFGARAITNRVRQMVGKIAYAIVDQTEKAQGGAGGQDIQRSAQRMGIEDLRRMATGESGMGPQAQAAAQAAIGQAGGWGAVAAGGVSGGGPGTGIGAFSVAGAGGSQWVPGGPLGTGGQGGGGGRGGRGGLWEGQLGGIMYGAYIAKRFWSYTGAPVMQAMEQYAGIQAEAQPLLTGQIPTEGAGALQAMRARSQYSLGQGAYNLFGGAVSASAQALQTPWVGTAAAGAGLFGGAALGAQILGKVGLRAGVAGAGMLAGAAPLIAAVGVGVTGLGIGADIYESIYGREMTPGRMVGAAAQYVGRLGAIGAMGVGAVVAGATGQQELYAERLGRRMESGYGRWLSQEYGTEVPEDQLATQDQLQEAAADMQISEEQVAGLLPGAFAVTGQRGVRGANERVLSTINQLVQTEGMSAAGAISAASEYAGALGYLPGEQGYIQAFNQYGTMTVGGRARATRDAQTRAGAAGQWRQLMGRDVISDPRLREEMDIFSTQQLGQIAFGGAAQLTRAGMGGMQALRIGQAQAMRVDAGQITEFQMQQGAGAMGDIAPYFSPAALRAYGGGVTEGLSDLGTGQANLVGRMMGGDVGAMSFGANIGMGPSYNALTNIAGQSMINVNLGQGLMGMAGFAQNMVDTSVAGGAISQLPGFQSLQGFAGRYGAAMQAGQGPGTAMRIGLGGLGVSQTMQDFFGNAPDASMVDYQREFSDKQFGLQMAGIGIGFQRIQMQRQFQYGGEDWRNPTADSLWGIQDRMRSLQWQGQQAGAAFSLERMDVGNQFGMRQEELSGRRMGVQQDYQRWGMGFQRAGMDLSRQFTMENRQFQDQLRGMSTAFTMEDFEENIRMSSGRQRRQLVTQRERFVSMTNVQDEQTERGREQQEEMWAREDEQFEKRREYSENLMALDEEQYNMGIERRETLFEMDRGDLERRIELSEKLHELQNEQIEKQREYAVAQMDLAQQALGIQAAAAAAQKEYNDDMLITADIVEEFAGYVSEVSKYDQLFNILKGLEAAASALDQMGVEKANALRDLAKTVGGLNPGGISALNRQLQILMATAGYGG